ncbi:MAG: helix-turn-helix transcriptional regulator [Polaromonas sp.]|nr:helix-turn-helix transcriptional regulator [Polaromonas sp.]
MPASQPPLFAIEKGLLSDFGDRLRAARLRRKFSVDVVAARAGISRMTLFRAEKGQATVSLGTYLRILEVLRLEQDIALLAKDDVLGRRLQDLELPKRRESGAAKKKAQTQ